MTGAPFDWMARWDRELIADRPLRVIGIDLGTTNSTITEVVWQPGSGNQPNADIIEVEQETANAGVYVGDVVPSVVALVEDRVLVGEGASRLRGAAKPHLERNRELFWETKNEIGTRRVFSRAPEGFQTPRDIAAHILTFLHEAAQDAAPQPIDRVVVTVPASFQWEQRRDTLEAARTAGLDLQPGDLLDEPVAAFLDYLAMHGTQQALGSRGRSRVLVLDFGGGTCDVAVLSVAQAGSGGLDVSRVGVSRFHRIGGSDIDMAIANDVLLPALLAQHGRQARDFSYTQKRDFILPALQGVAASLKVKLSVETRRRRALGTFDPDDRAMSVSLPAAIPVPVRGRGDEIETLSLSSPTLTLPQLSKALSAFLSRTLLAPRDTEYTHANSVFAPVNDVLTRCDLLPEDIDAVLLVGGSSLFTLLADAVEQYFPSAAILTYREPRDALRCVGRGAAFHALLLAAYGSSPLSPTTGDAVSIRTRQGQVTLVPRNAALPYPSEDGWAEVDTLRMPAGDGRTPRPLTLSVVSGEQADDARTMAHHPVTVAPPVRRGDRITVRSRVDANQRLTLQAIVSTAEGEQRFDVDLDNPFSVTINPNATRERIMELEEQTRSRTDRAAKIRAFRVMARLHSELGECDRACELYENLLPMLSRLEQGRVLNALGVLYGRMGDVEAQTQAYRRAAELSGNTAPLFNLALSMQQRGRHDEALDVIDEAFAIDQDVADRALRGWILADLGRRDEARADRRTALDRLGSVESAEDFELSWALHAARGVGDQERAREIAAEQRRRARNDDNGGSGTGAPDGGGEHLPERVVEDN